MITPEDVIAEARSWLGTPFLHQGRSRSGIDCVGLPIVISQNLGTLADDFQSPDYGRIPNRGQLEHQIDRYCAPLDAPIPAALIAFSWNRKDSAHVGIYTGSTIIHSYEKRGKVIEHGFRGKWLDRVSGIWALPGVMYE